MADSSLFSREPLSPSFVGALDAIVGAGVVAETLPVALQRHGLRGDWETLMTEVERRGWYVITSTGTPPADDGPIDRRVILGLSSAESHVTIDGTGRTIIEALGWAMVRALDATLRPILD